ncbi:chemotaxis protein CheW [Algoriphagus sp.]|uniref:chemotaxis protein CheW n=1 Tax=Algoriphagus sp. TaxID=1872435 RepID=UPI0025EECC8C|nr:chemotaxis protein CheW [Algoriphagus sp.]
MEEKSNVNSYLLFTLGKEIFAANVNQVLNILEMLRITEVPNSAPYMKGVINLRGEVLPVIDTRVKFGMSEIEFNKNTCIVVMDIKADGETLRVGALVDSVVVVLEIHEKDLLPVPNIGDTYKTDFISNMTQYNDQFVMVLSVDKVFSTEEIIDLKSHKQQTEKLKRDTKKKEKEQVSVT